MAGAAGAVHGRRDTGDDARRDATLRADGRVARRRAAGALHARGVQVHPGDRPAAEGNAVIAAAGPGLIRHARTLTPFSGHSWSTSTSSEAQSSRVRHWIVSKRLPIIGSTLRQYRV